MKTRIKAAAPTSVTENRLSVVSLDSADGVEQEAVGSKAISLMRMKKIGLPVPPGFCVMGSAFRKHLEENGLVPLTQAVVDQLGAASHKARKSLLSDIREAIIAAPLAELLKREIKNHCLALGSGYFAVRSSATAEDLPGHSFAGQYETYLGLIDISSCLDAIKKCWASLWTERAYEYRQKNGFDHLSVNMAAIVQVLIRPEISGVLFTVDPVSGREDQIVIEGCFGLGEALVSGKVTPDRLVLRKDNFQIVSRLAGVKRIEFVLDELGGVKEQTLPKDQAGTCSIDIETAQRLAELSKKAEAIFGTPQDMEWAVRRGEVFLLQSRPITTLKKRSWEDRQVWSNLNAGEVMPDVVTPMTWSVIKPVGAALADALFGQLGLDFGNNPIFGEIAGRVYFNLNTLVGAVRCLPGCRHMDVTRIFGGAQSRMADDGRLALDDEDIPDLNFSLLKLVLRLPGFIYWFLSHSPEKGERFVVDMRRYADELDKADLASMTDKMLYEHLRTTLGSILTRINAIAFTGIGMFYFDCLDKICRKWLGDWQGTFANRLISGIGGVDSAEAGLDLWRLAGTAHGQATIETTILGGENWVATRERIEKIQGGRLFLEEWDCFITKHGHHTRGELELANARWSETPDYVLSTLRGYLKGMDQADPIARHKSSADEREQLADCCRKKLRNPLKRALFNYCLKQAQRGCSVRENLKSLLVRCWSEVRHVLLAIGKRLVDRGILKNRDDIFFLQVTEIPSVIDKKADFDIRKTIEERQAEYARNLKVTPPEVVVGEFNPDNFVPDEVDEVDIEVLRGIAVSPGVVTGPAHVILRSDADEQVRPGEILVAPFTDPGWTPYFLQAAAIVMDQGGLLSHGSIVAREYGIPAVVNVGPATKIIKTGQIIQVDATKGLVRILG